MIHRRELLRSAATLGAASVLGSESIRAGDVPASSARITDTNVSLFQWPFRRLSLDDPQALVNKLRSLGITQAWAGSFEGLLHRDVSGVNQRLADACRLHAELVPIGSVNLELPGWEDDLSTCMERHDMPGIRLHPNYHGYTLADPRVSQLLQRATSAGRFVQIAAAMEDVRTQHPMLQVQDVDLTPLPALMRNNAGAAVQILNLRPRGPLRDQLAETSGVFFDTARVDGTDSIRQLLRSVPRGRVLFGTHSPFLIPEAGLIRVAESNLEAEELQSLLWENAQQLNS